MIGLALFQVYRLTIDTKFSFYELIYNNVKRGFLIIKGNDQ
jgi:hypothetical protein